MTNVSLRDLAEQLITVAQRQGGQLSAREVVEAVEAVELTPAQAKKILRALVDAGVTVVVDGNRPTRRRVASRQPPPQPQSPIRDLRLRHGLTQAGLANLLKITTAKMSRIERGIIQLDERTTAGLQAVFGDAWEAAGESWGHVEVALLTNDPTHFLHNYERQHGNAYQACHAFVRTAEEFLGTRTVARAIKGLRSAPDDRFAVLDAAGDTADMIFSGLLIDEPAVRRFLSAIENRSFAVADSEPDPSAPEHRLRHLVHDGRFSDVADLLAETVDPEDGGRRDEFAFLHWTDPDRELVTALWSLLAEGNDFPVAPPRMAGKWPATSAHIPGPADRRATVSAAETVVPVARAATSRRPAVAIGAALEEATVRLFETFFLISDPDRDDLVTQVRRQSSGSQFGYDVQVTGSNGVQCYVECKNLDRPPTLKDIGDKLIERKRAARDQQIDHWILISPHRDPAPSLQQMLDQWANDDEWPFSIQVWSPATHVREFFALEPAVYRQVYNADPPDTGSDPQRIVAAIRRRLEPRLRLPERWRKYLRDPDVHCIGTEKAEHFAELYAHHVESKARDERGSLLDGTLMDRIDRWLARPADPNVLLLADFGEGKSFFTYCLSRRLCERTLADPSSGILPLRVPLSEYRAGGDGQGLLKRRLEVVGATLADWREVRRTIDTLGLLDGFDEMSVDLSVAAITENIRHLASCVEALTGSKVLVTSRGRVLDGTRNRERILDRLDRPETLNLAPVPREETIQYLERFATGESGTQVLRVLRESYDPIGLAKKPLFLQMIRATLDDLPTEGLDERILYQTYVGKSLRHKIKYLRDPGEDLGNDEVVANVERILEQVALDLQRANDRFVYLRDVSRSSPLAERLWQTRDGADRSAAASEDDAQARLGVRSLLKGVTNADPDRWPVTFFHRSLQEYFVARAIVRMLREDPSKARAVLDELPPLPEITLFAAAMLRAEPDTLVLDQLESMARSATIRCGSRYLGGHALTLLYAGAGRLPEADWSGLNLDYALLAGVNLAGARLVGSTLCYANLDNADLDNADLTGANLEGVRFEETPTVTAVAGLGPDRIIAAYRDRTIREWRAKPGGGCASAILATVEHDVDELSVTPRGRIVATGQSSLSVLTPGKAAWGCAPRFRLKSIFRAPVIGERTALYAQEMGSGLTRVIWLAHGDSQDGSGTTLDSFDPGHPVQCYALADGIGYAVAGPDEVTVVWRPPDGGLLGSLEIPEAAVSCMTMFSSGDGTILLATGHHSGALALAEIVDGRVTERWRIDRHEASVTSVAFLDRDRIVSGGLDRAVRVTSAANPADGDGSPGTTMRLTLRCRGVRIDGVTPQREHDLLAKFSALSAQT